MPAVSCRLPPPRQAPPTCQAATPLGLAPLHVGALHRRALGLGGVHGHAQPGKAQSGEPFSADALISLLGSMPGVNAQVNAPMGGLGDTRRPEAVPETQVREVKAATPRVAAPAPAATPDVSESGASPSPYTGPEVSGLW